MSVVFREDAIKPSLNSRVKDAFGSSAGSSAGFLSDSISTLTYLGKKDYIVVIVDTPNLRIVDPHVFLQPNILSLY